VTAATTTGCPGRSASPWSSPEARLLLRADAPREQWLAQRRAGIGSSDASAVVGVNQWTSPYEVWAEKRGLLAPSPSTEATEMGNWLEPVVVGRWSEKSGVPIRKAGLMQSRTRPWQLASVDRLAACGGIVEAKTLSFRVAEEWEDGQTPDHAEVQVQHQMAVTGRSHAHVVGLQDGRTWLERTVVRDDDLIADLVAAEEQFWQLVLTGVEPAIDGRTATTDALNARWSGVTESETQLGSDAELLIATRAAWDAQLTEAEQGKELASNQLRALLGEHTVGVLPSGKKVTWRRNGNVAPKRLTAAEPELVAELTVLRPALDLDALKRDHPAVYATHRARVLRVPTV